MTEPISEPDLRTDTEREADSNAEEARQNLEPEVPDPKLSDEERELTIPPEGDVPEVDDDPQVDAPEVPE